MRDRLIDPRYALQETLGTAFTIERELGGGGMSRVYVAEEAAFERRVVLKVLAPELAAGVDLDRFKREIQLAATLQHPHIVPVITAGESAGLPYYTMPFVQGESLRDRLARDGRLPIDDAIAILRDVAKALSYAHDRGIVHRDIKPGNVLLTGDSAMVADFGIAKALVASRGEGTTDNLQTKLTYTGMSIGTLGYMAPEQAAGGADVDHRADLYSLGCVAYEMVTGQAPFGSLSPQRLLAAHMSEMPRAVSSMRPETPPALASLIMRTLAKEPSDRPRDASDVVRALGAMGSGTPTAAMPLLARALVAYVVAFAAVVLAARTAIGAIGLPGWVLPGAMLVMGLGLPVILLTAAQVSAHLSWRRAALGGGYAVGAFVLLVGGYMVLRAFGIGPVGSLLAKGVIRERDEIIVTDFDAPGDSTLGSVLGLGVRTMLSDSRSVTVTSARQIESALALMNRPRTTHIDLTLARDIALRLGTKAILHGTVTRVDAAYIVTLRLVNAQSGDELTAIQRTSKGADGLITAVGEATSELRERIGESLKRVNAAPALASATTASIDALRKYTEAVQATGAGQFDRAIALDREALAIDSTFALAWRNLGANLGNGDYSQIAIDSAYRRAYELRGRLTERERLVTTGGFFLGPGRDRSRSISAFEALLKLGDYGYTNPIGNQLVTRREFARADSLARVRISLEPTRAITYSNRTEWLFAQGRLDAAESAFVVAAAHSPPDWQFGAYAVSIRALLAYARGRSDQAIAILDSARAHHGGAERAGDLEGLAAFAMLRGQLHTRDQLLREAAAVRSPSRAANAVSERVRWIEADAWFHGPTPRHASQLDSLVAGTAFTALPPTYREYLGVARAYAFVGQAARARALLGRYEREVHDTAVKRDELPRIHGVRGEIALAEHRPMDAVAEFRLEDVAPDGFATSCAYCLSAGLARAFSAAGNADSTIWAIEQYLAVTRAARVYRTTPVRLATLSYGDYFYLALLQRRLGALYEEKGNTSKAAANYQAFIDLWKDADAELQPQVVDVRKRLAILGAPR